MLSRLTGRSSAAWTCLEGRHGHRGKVETTLNLIGIFAFALSGALLAVRRRFDIVGMAVLATVTALGGGIIRDVLIGRIPPAAITDPWVLTLPLIAAAVAFFFHPRLERMGRTVLVFDAIGLGVFCATATTTAAATGIPPMAAVLLGSITGVGGGILRDVLAGQTPSVLCRDSQLYAIPAIAGSIVVTVAYSWGVTNVAVQATAAAGICGFRLPALRFGWRAPVCALQLARGAVSAGVSSCPTVGDRGVDGDTVHDGNGEAVSMRPELTTSVAIEMSTVPSGL